MDFQEKLQKCRDEIYQKVSTKNITLLNDFGVNQNLRFNKNGKYFYSIINHGIDGYDLEIKHINKFLNQLDDKKVYIIIPILSVNNTPDEPFIILSKQILVSKVSNEKLITDYLNNKSELFFNIYLTDKPEQMFITFKYKEIQFNFNEKEQFK
uniref:Uncharacterized protein n=1 Tax=Russula virescens TaxID=71688 RepID=A0A2S0U400_9AGAM|nr:hypothetical protein [Russula virescens]AWB36222.1 hypothetical protein [Russula virescens]